MRDSSDSSSLDCGPLVGAGLLVFVALFSLCAQCHCHGDPTDESDWRDAAEAVVERAEPTDGIRVHPTWTEAPLVHLQQVGNLLNRHRAPLLEDLVGIERLLIITDAKRRDEALDRLPFDASTGGIDSFGAVEVLEVDVPDSLRIRTDATPFLDGAEVAVFRGDELDERCRRRGSGPPSYRCDHHEVRSVLLEVEDDPRRCITANPPGGERHLSVELTVDDASDVLRVRAGLDNRAARLPSGGDVAYRLYVDGELVADQRLDAHTSSWKPHDVSTTDRLGRSVTLRMEVESVDPSPHHRRFCFNAWPLSRQQASP